MASFVGPLEDGASSNALQRAHLVRSVAQILSAEAPLAELLARCCVPLSFLVDAYRVTIVATDARRNKVVYVWEDSAGGPPESDIVAPDSVAFEVFASQDTVVRGEPGAICLGVPIRFGTTLLGAVILDGIAQYHPEDVTLLESCALYLGARIYYENSLQNSERYATLAFTDSLTGIANRRKFDETLAREWSRALRNETELTL